MGIVLLALACLAFGAEQKRKQSYKGPELEILEAKAHRSEGIVNVDARVKNCGVKPIKGLVLLFDFMAPGRAVITTQKIAAEEEIVEPGQEVMFHVQLTDPVRAVRFQLQAVDADTRDLKVAKPGPYHIE